MNQSPIQVSLLQKRIRELESEIERLRHLLKLHGITEHDNLEIQENIYSPQITAEHARLLYSYFKGRKDVFEMLIRKAKGYIILSASISGCKGNVHAGME